jgi:hypothetical protein
MTSSTTFLRLGPSPWACHGSYLTQRWLSSSGGRGPGKSGRGCVPEGVGEENTITRWTDVDRGGHFAALEGPILLVGDVREFFRTLR